jgi:hypothetical protein
MPGRIPEMNFDEILATLQWNNARDEPFILELGQMEFNALLVVMNTKLVEDNKGENYIYSPAGEIIEQIRRKKNGKE